MMRKPNSYSQAKITFKERNGGGCTSVGQQVGGDDPTTLVKSVESIGDADERSTDDGGLES